MNNVPVTRRPPPTIGRAVLVICLLHLGLPNPCDASVNELSIVDAGARAGESQLNTVPIQAAIDQLAVQGGGRLVVPAGTYKTGALFLKQGVELHLTEGAVLLGSTDLADYPRRMTRIEGHFEPWRPALINAANMDRVVITGSGVLDGNGKPFWAAFWKRRQQNPKCTNLEVERPRLIFIDTSTDVQVSGITLRNSGFWNLHLYRCQNVFVENVTITAPHGKRPQITDVHQPWDEISIDRAPSSDGIDIDSCQGVTIRGCVISVGDDCIALKGTKGPLAMDDESSPPVMNVVVENCDFENGHGMLTCGSEATIIRNVSVSDSRVGPGVPVVRLKLRPDTPQLYENFVFANLQLDAAQALFDVKPWTQFFDLGEHAPPKSVVRNIVISDVTGSVKSLGELRGNEGDEISNVTLDNVQLRAENPSLRVDENTILNTNSTMLNGKQFPSP